MGEAFTEATNLEVGMSDDRNPDDAVDYIIQNSGKFAQRDLLDDALRMIEGVPA